MTLCGACFVPFPCWWIFARQEKIKLFLPNGSIRGRSAVKAIQSVQKQTKRFRHELNTKLNHVAQSSFIWVYQPNPWTSCSCQDKQRRGLSRFVHFDSAFQFVYFQLASFSGVLACLDGYMNIALDQTEEYQNGQLKNKYGDAFIRGNNVLYISTQKIRRAT